jgi:pimeloyl-ACP methyl ester carboxylesterase
MAELERGDGGRLHYEVVGDPVRPVVVLLNGMTQTTANWKTQAKGLSAAARVVTYDARGQGKSDVGEEALTLELHARDLVYLLDHLGVERASLVGFSHGSRVALAFANEAPERLERLVLSAATAEPTALAQTIIRSWREILRLGGLEAMSWASLPNILGTRFLADNQPMLDGIVRASVQRNSQAGIERLLDAMIAYPSLKELASGVRAPTLVLYGEADLLVDRAGAARLAELTAGELESIPSVGHTIPIEAPEAFREAVWRFLRLG